MHFINFFLDYFFNPEFFLVCLLLLFFIECSNNLFTIEITNNISPWHIILCFLDQEDFLRIIYCVALRENFLHFGIWVVLNHATTHSPPFPPTPIHFYPLPPIPIKSHPLPLIYSPLSSISTLFSLLPLSFSPLPPTPTNV